ncbi:MAG: zinc-ribbon domain-containing protein [Oscillospiraceae bacterium]
MKFCSNCGRELADDAVICPNCGSAVPQAAPQKEDKRSVGLNIVGFLFPLIGLILYLCLKKDTPVRAKSIGKWALIGFIIAVVLGVIGGVIGAKQAMAPASRTFESYEDGITETLSLDATGDIIHTMVDTMYVDTEGATEADIEAFRAQCDADYADLIALDFCDYSFTAGDDQVVISLTFTKLDDAENVKQLAASGFYDLDEDSAYLSLALSSSGLLSEGWVEK